MRAGTFGVRTSGVDGTVDVTFDCGLVTAEEGLLGGSGVVPIGRFSGGEVVSEG